MEGRLVLVLRGKILDPRHPATAYAAFSQRRTSLSNCAANLLSLAASLTTPAAPARRQRILAQRGTTFQPVAMADVAYFFSENKLTFLVTRTGERCLVNEPLGTLASELDPTQFFRLNRNFLAHVAAVKNFTPVGKGRLSVQLNPRSAEEVLVSQENARDFRAWAGR